jgi:hypothetical protein
MIYYSSGVDLSLLDVIFLDASPITRDINREHNFSINVHNPSVYNIIPLEDPQLFNFNIKYFMSSEHSPNVSEMLLVESPDQSRDLLDPRGVASGAATSVPFSVRFDLTLARCEAFTFLCVVDSDRPRASWTELTLADNVLCANIDQHITCHPGNDHYILLTNFLHVAIGRNSTRIRKEEWVIDVQFIQPRCLPKSHGF